MSDIFIYIVASVTMISVSLGVLDWLVLRRVLAMAAYKNKIYLKDDASNFFSAPSTYFSDFKTIKKYESQFVMYSSTNALYQSVSLVNKIHKYIGLPIFSIALVVGILYEYFGKNL